MAMHLFHNLVAILLCTTFSCCAGGGDSITKKRDPLGLLPPRADSVSIDILKPLPKPRFDFDADSCFIGTYIEAEKSKEYEAVLSMCYLKGDTLFFDSKYYGWPGGKEPVEPDDKPFVTRWGDKSHPRYLPDSSVLIQNLLFSNDTMWTLDSYQYDEYGCSKPSEPWRRKHVSWLVRDWRTYRQDKAARIAASKYLDSSTIFYANYDGTRNCRPHRLYWDGTDYIWEEYTEWHLLQHYPVTILQHGNKYSITSKRDPRTDVNVQRNPKFNDAFWYDSLVYEPGKDTIFKYYQKDGKIISRFAAKIVKDWEYDYGLLDIAICNGTHQELIDEWRKLVADDVLMYINPTYRHD
jgi:hypothetical protein